MQGKRIYSLLFREQQKREIFASEKRQLSFILTLHNTFLLPYLTSLVLLSVAGLETLVSITEDVSY